MGTEDEVIEASSAERIGSGEPAAADISRRVAAILDDVEREATQIRGEAREDAARYRERARVEADALLAERRQRIAELSDELIAKSEAVIGRLDHAAPVREGFEQLVRRLGDAADQLADEIGDARIDVGREALT
jgi:F0F1-type ATP synthase membrane subunit b/b'